MIQGAVFDVDGVLLDSMEIWDDAGARYLKSIGIRPESNLGEKVWEMTVQESAAYIKEHYHLKLSEDEIVQGVLDTVRDFYYFDANIKPGVKNFVEKLAANGIPMAIASTGEKDYIKRALERHNIAEYFKGIITPAEAGMGKSEPVMYQLAAELLGTEPKETYVFEDALYAIRTANEAGFKTVGVYDSFSKNEQKAIREEADIYMVDLTEFKVFWRRIF